MINPIADVVSGVVEGIAAPIKAVGDAINQNKQLDQAPNMAQIATNNIEAASSSWFTSGWRPFVGWVCGLGLLLYYIPQFLIADFLWVKMCLVQHALLTFPINANDLITLLLGMLGFGGLRTFEKYMGVSK